jgi:hypothetical protein
MNLLYWVKALDFFMTKLNAREMILLIKTAREIKKRIHGN